MAHTFSSDQSRALLGILLDTMRQGMRIILRRRDFLASLKAEGNMSENFAGETEATIMDVMLANLRVHEFRIPIVYERPTGTSDAEANETLPEGGLVLVVDPLDGTSAFMKLGTNVGIMMALVEGETVHAALIGNAITGEILGYGPGDEGVTCWYNQNLSWPVVYQPRQLSSGNVLIRRAPTHHSPRSEWMLAGRRDKDFLDPENALHGLFRGQQTEEGSAGLSFARLARGDVVSLIIPRRPDTPWDMAPAIGIMRKLGFLGIRIGYFEDSWTDAFRVVPWRVPREITRPRTERLVIHESQLNEFIAWQRWPRQYKGDPDEILVPIHRSHAGTDAYKALLTPRHTVDSDE